MLMHFIDAICLFVTSALNQNLVPDNDETLC